MGKVDFFYLKFLFGNIAVSLFDAALVMKSTFQNNFKNIQMGKAKQCSAMTKNSPLPTPNPHMIRVKEPKTSALLLTKYIYIYI